MSRRDVEKKRNHREKLLTVIYTLAEGNPNTFVDLKDALRSTSTNAEGGIDYLRELAGYWIDKDYMRALGNKRNAKQMRITAKGIDYIEPKMLEGQELT